MFKEWFNLHMQIGTTLRDIRKSKNLSQGDIEKRTGLLRCYTSRVENGMTVPSIETLEKYASALEIPLYTLFYDGKSPLRKPYLAAKNRSAMFGEAGAELAELKRFAKALSRMDDRSRSLLIYVAQGMARRSKK
jgi:transcriptional regulator with XRE-family HTH domain